jgi:lipoate-protein ligase A
LSLGYFQTAAERESHEASRDCDLVRRPSGGGAILHDRELTYCLVLPEALAKTRPHTHWYFAVHHALIASLDELTGASGNFSLCQNPPDVPASDEPFLCFQRRAEGDVLLGEHKIAGSAQRRRGGAILQHGSVLLARSPHAAELPGVTDLLPASLEFANLRNELVIEIASKLQLSFYESSLTAGEARTADHLRSTKYDCSSWTRRR